MTSIGQYAFYKCANLIKVNYIGTVDGWAQIKFADYTSSPLQYAKNLYINNELVTMANITTATIIPAHAFCGCSSLKSVTIGGNVTLLDYGSFSKCTNLTSVVITDSVKIISAYAFAECSRLTEMVIPNSVTKVDFGAFFDCTNLTQIQFNGTREQISNICKTGITGSNIKRIICTDGVIELESWKK